jgi:hypothetical protein
MSTTIDLSETPEELAALAAQPTPDTFVMDGYIVDAATGEVLGLLEDDTFMVTSPDAADWVLKKIAGEEAAIVALDVQEQAILTNIARLRKQFQARVKFLHWKFDAQLEALARDQLAVKKGRPSKTYTLPHGSIVFRNVPESYAVEDMESAVEFVEAIEPELVTIKIEKRVTSAQARHAAELAGLTDLDVPGLKVNPAYEKVTIATGIERALRSPQR